MFVGELMTVVTKAMKNTFDADYPESDFHNLWISPEYPYESQHMPALWVDFSTTTPLSIAGVDHREYIIDGNGQTREVRRWRFAGEVTYTVLTLSSLERARLVDEVIKVIAFGDRTQGRGAFRSYIDTDNDLIAINLDYDTLELQGWAATQGTSWGSEDWVYEVTIQVSCQGEFVSTPEGYLVNLSRVDVFSRREDEPDTTSTNPPWN